MITFTESAQFGIATDCIANDRIATGCIESCQQVLSL